MGAYYMVADNSNSRSYWQRCKAKTLLGAKREATKELGQGYIDDVLLIAEGSTKYIVARKKNTAPRWQNIPYCQSWRVYLP